MSTGSESSPTAPETWTVQRILEWTAQFLKQKGVDSPRLEAELLLAHARKCPRIRLYMDFNDPVSESDRAVMRELVQRRARREPLAYIVGTREFYGRQFEVGPGVLVPRPETETLVDLCLERLPRTESRCIAEVGFGSGCIAVTIVKQRPSCRVLATDLSPVAMQVAERNVARHEAGDRVTLYHGSLLQPVRESGLQMDGIVSNPPYIRDDERDALQPEVRLHEPPEALFAGPDGLDVIRKLVGEAPSVLKPGGFLMLEIDPGQVQTVRTLLLESGFEATTVHRDLNGQERVVAATLAAGAIG